MAETTIWPVLNPTSSQSIFGGIAVIHKKRPGLTPGQFLRRAAA
jgi:hypothetical protein